MPHDVIEGHFYQGADSICYPEISSCLTVTCVGNGLVAGGHAVLRPVGNKLGLGEILDCIQRRIRQPRHVFLIGDTGGEWENNINYLSGGRINNAEGVDGIADYFQLGPTSRTKVDVDDFTHGKGSVDVYVSPIGSVQVKKDGKTLFFKTV